VDAEIEEKWRRLYVATTRARHELHLLMPQRFSTHGQSAYGDRHVHAAKSWFIPNELLGLFNRTAWPRGCRRTRRCRAGEAAHSA
jgi:DNA helicase-2/ATP-dependent DNA helicase PcrA